MSRNGLIVMITIRNGIFSATLMALCLLTTSVSANLSTSNATNSNTLPELGVTRELDSYKGVKYFFNKNPPAGSRADILEYLRNKNIYDKRVLENLGILKEFEKRYREYTAQLLQDDTGIIERGVGNLKKKLGSLRKFLRNKTEKFVGKSDLQQAIQETQISAESVNTDTDSKQDESSEELKKALREAQKEIVIDLVLEKLQRGQNLPGFDKDLIYSQTAQEDFYCLVDQILDINYRKYGLSGKSDFYFNITQEEFVKTGMGKLTSGLQRFEDPELEDTIIHSIGVYDDVPVRLFTTIISYPKFSKLNAASSNIKIKIYRSLAINLSRMQPLLYKKISLPFVLSHKIGLGEIHTLDLGEDTQFKKGID